MSFWTNLGSGLVRGFTSNPIGTIGSLVSGFTSIGAGRREEKRRKRLMAYQDKINDENWQMQYERQLADQRQMIQEDREYNSIGQQMRRAREAGVSPLAALGVSAGSSIGASSPSPSHGGVSQANAPTDSAQMLGSNLMQSMASLKAMQMQDAQIRKLNEETASVKLDNVKKTFDNLIAEIKANGYTKEYGLQIDKLASEIDALQKQAGYTSAQTETENARRDAEIADLRAGAEYKHEQTTDLQQTRDSRIASNEASASRNYEEAEDLQETRFARLYQMITNGDLNNENVIKQSFHNWYERKYHRNVSSGLNSFIDIAAQRLIGIGSQPNDHTENAFGERGLVGYFKRGLLNTVSDQAFKRYWDVFWDYITSTPIERLGR